MSPVYASSTIVDVYKLMATHTHTNASSHTHARAHICHTSAHTSAHASVIEYMCLYPSMLYICKSLPYISFSCLSVLSSGTVWVYPTCRLLPVSWRSRRWSLRLLSKLLLAWPLFHC